MRPALLALFTGLVGGCSSGPTLYHVEGTVIYDGKPLSKGMIFFDPTPDNDGPQGHAIISDGRYSTREELGQGIVGGQYVVRIQGFDGKPGNELPLGRPLFTGHVEHRTFEPKDQTQDFDVKK